MDWIVNAANWFVGLFKTGGEVFISWMTGIVPLVLVTLSRGLRARFDAHVRIARWTFPMWVYVSVTGVLVYLMLYRLY